MKKLISILFFTLITLTKSFGQAIPCPTVNAQVGTGPSTYICVGQCANLSASVSAIVAQTNSYVVSSIPYYNFPYAGGSMAVWNADDMWGQVIPIGFNFCYFGNSYNQLVVGTNGVVTFNLALAGGGCNWSITTALPSAANMPANSIACPFRDIVTNGVDYAHYYVTGTAPCRAMVIYWQNIPLFSCVNPRTWTQLVLYEGTNIIDVNIQNSSICAWNNGRGIVGIQNLGPTTAYCPPGRNFPSSWNGINESWRFSPAGASTATWSWSGPSGVVGAGTTIAVCPTVTTTYTASCVMGCAGPSAYQGTVQVIVNPSPTVAPTSNAPICQGSQLNILANGGGTMTTYAWIGPNGFTSAIQNPTISVAQPSNSGTYSLVASNNFTIGPSCVSSGSTLVTVVPVSQVTVTPSFTLCQGSSLNLTSVNTTPPTSYSWTGPNTFTSTLQNPIIPNTTVLNSGNYVVVTSFSTPNIPLVCTSSAVSNVSIVATSPVTVTTPANICEHTTANLTASANPNALLYTWTGPNGFSATGTNPVINNISPAATGMYNVIATWAIGSVSCNINGLNAINVIPVAPVTINQPITVCYPGNVSLTASSQGASSYSWSATNGYTTNLQNPYFAAPSPTLSGIYTVVTTYTNGSVLTCYNSNTTQVTINPILTFTLPPFERLCSNVSHTILGPVGATSYTWNGPAGISNLQNYTLPWTQTNNSGVYTLIVNLGPCQTSASQRIEILSPISYTQTPGNRVICDGDKITLVVGAAGGSENYAYNWNPYNYLATPTGSLQQNIQPQGTTIYNVSVYDIACPNYTISTTLTVTVNKPPVPDLRLDKVSGCEPLCLTYNSHTQNTAESITYDFGNGNVMIADSFVYCLDNGNYNLNIKTKGKNGCVGTYTMPYTINVWPTPHSDINWSPDPVSTVNNHVTFEPTFGFGPIVEYQWSFLGTNADTSSVRNPERIYDKVGKYQVMLISKTDKGCIDTTFRILEVRDDFNIFIPNTFTPNGDGMNDTFCVKGLGAKTEGFSMEVYNRWGELIYSTKDITKGWDGTFKGLNVQNGVYVYVVKALGANGEGKKEFKGHVSLLK